MPTNARPYFAAYYRWLVIHHHLVSPDRAARLLDVGCDDASILRHLPAGLRLGVDMHPRWQPNGDTALVRAHAAQLPLLDSRFDRVLAFDVLEHIENDRAVMHDMLRVLTPDGVLWFSTPARDTRMVPWFITPYTNRSFGHVRNGYTPAELRALLPNQSAWHFDYFYWNEPYLRAGFVVLHVLDRLLPALADQLTRACYTLDRRVSQGTHGHIFGSIRAADYADYY